jgi:calcineurin-like phosphoesterase family protein
MDEYMIGKWNSAVSQNDLVFHLGDVFERYFYKDYLLTHMPIDEIPLKTAIGNGLLKGNIHGHTHSKNQHLNRDFYRCCCVELIAYTPILFNEFVNI